MAAESDADCVFCSIVQGTAASYRIDEDERTVAFMDINPATWGHALVIPKAHATDPARDALELPWVPTPGDPDSIAQAADRLARLT